MARNGVRLPSSANRVSNDSEFVLPLSPHHLNGWRTFLTSLSPFVSRTSGRTFSVYARRLLTEVNNPQEITTINIPPARERHPIPILGVWSNRISGSINSNDENNFVALSSPENEDIAINIDSNSSREQQHRHSTSPLYTNTSENVLQLLPGNNDALFHATASSINSDIESLNTEDSQQIEGGTGLSINGEPITDLLDRHPELTNILKVIGRNCIFALLILIKLIYDRFSSLLIIVSFLTGFIFSNKVIKLCVSHQERRSKRLTLALLSVLVLIPLCIYGFYLKTSTNLYYSAILMPPDTDFLSLDELLWIVIITDLVLKLSFVFIKGLVVVLPSFILHYKYRGKHLAMIEFTSQLYRSLAPVQPWISYLLDNYTGVQKVFGVFLSAIYMLCKCPDIIYRVKNVRRVVKKMQNSNYGSTPSATDLQDSEGVCPICQDDFASPTMLPCKHVFCEPCVARWFDSERTCPMCRTKVAHDPRYRDGSTTYNLQWY